MPQLPLNFDETDHDENELALYNKAQSTWTKAYEVETFLNNRTRWNVMQIPFALQGIFRRCGETGNEGVGPLQKTLIEIFRRQDGLGVVAGGLPPSFTDAEVRQHSKEFDTYREWYEMRQLVNEMLETDDDG
ncbi:hypothetical protein BBP40_005806 [Aspergillus hancockii]|nr:hypothetical protein BBP40_005806 [Aspergillus hancockii]